MRNLKVCMAYNGAAYHGFQRQDNAVTVQGTVEKALKEMFKKEIGITGCSRTDTGVHARCFYFNVFIDNAIPCENFIRGMNTLLPQDIALISCEEVDESFHARYNTKSKEYIYRICNTKQRNVFEQNLSLWFPYKLDAEFMNEKAQLFVGTHDFAGFCRADAKQYLKSTVRTVYSFNVRRNGDFVEFTISGDGFLYNMVRILVGTLVDMNDGRKSDEEILNALRSGDRTLSGKTLSPCGLYLNKVEY